VDGSRPTHPVAGVFQDLKLLLTAHFIIVEECTMFELLGPAMSITTAALLARTSLRTWRAENKFLKWVGTGLAAFFSAAVSVISVIMIVGLFKLKDRYHGRTDSARSGDLQWLL